MRARKGERARELRDLPSVCTLFSGLASLGWYSLLYGVFFCRLFSSFSSSYVGILCLTYFHFHFHARAKKGCTHAGEVQNETCACVQPRHRSSFCVDIHSAAYAASLHILVHKYNVQRGRYNIEVVAFSERVSPLFSRGPRPRQGRASDSSETTQIQRTHSRRKYTRGERFWDQKHVNGK